MKRRSRPLVLVLTVGAVAIQAQTAPPHATTAPAAPLPSAAATQPTTAPATQPAGPPALNYSGDWWSRPALTGDWFGARNWLSQHGVRLDAQVVQYAQGNASGGRSTNGSFQYGGTADYALNFDFQKLGLWPGGFARIRGETKFGRAVNSDVGAVSSANFNSLLPLPQPPGLTTLTEYWIMQFVSPKLGFIAGQVDLTALPGQNRFASDRYAHFMNLSFWQNPVALSTVPYSTMTAGAFYAPTKWFDGATLVCDSYGTASRSGFSEGLHGPQGATIIQALNFHIEPFGRPGTQRLNFSYSTRPRYPLEDVDRLLLSGIAPPFVDRVLLSQALGMDQEYGWAMWYDFDQYVCVEPEDPNQGWGLFGRFGWSPGEVNPVESFYSLGVGGKGVVPTRDRDRFGIGYYMLNFTDELRGILQANAEQGVELFYNIEITPWLHITPDLQVIINPGGATDSRAREPAIVYGLRMQMNL